MSWRGRRGDVWRGEARRGAAGRGSAGAAWIGEAGHVLARLGGAGKVSFPSEIENYKKEKENA